ncbi:biotin transport system substrate-specific component [Tistlia consotensis]|uniref:Biotin transporter n=1 Tax=Tistlia consotensis USBA 355 TaxID=560819 RepID=A0A1Y6CQT8_9PROT|nr:biotin transporter BioY [Tistlia consotensis]SMF82573.1 biotin transport system substrate-specific component [Tistlia consotensis USBA 355]SNS29374.1 biotin transport system substrate-specific component [Tistlia consotensis]
MADIRLSNVSLLQAAWPVQGAQQRVLRDLLMIVAGSILLTVSAKIQVPFWPVPMTMQTYAVILLGAVLGWRVGTASVLLYLAEGAIGLPVFAAGGGLAYFAGPTAGYLVGFALSALLVGLLAARGWDRRLPTALLMMAAGTVVILALGVAWLSVFLGSLDKAVAAGLTPFLLGAVFKTALAALTAPLGWKLVQRLRG